MGIRIFVICCCIVSCALGAVPIDPDTYRTMDQMITSRGYPCENHYAVTPDGYILHLFRIPHGVKNSSNASRSPVFLQHGVLDNSFTWIVNEANQSLAYILADAGYDVWMGNNRGNKYSTNHTTLDINSKQFWDFTWDEMAKYDVPAQAQYILNVTGFSNLTYVGHSEGTTIFFAGMIMNPAFASKINLFVGLGPVGNVSHIDGSTFFYQLAKYHGEYILELFGDKFAPPFTVLNKTFEGVCAECPECCADFIEFICGKHQGDFNNSRFPVIMGHEPGGTSTKNVIHWAQAVKADKFCMYDYGPIGNVEHYKSLQPPVYEFSNFPKNLPVALFSGSVDTLADPTDVATLAAQIPNLVKWDVIQGYAHLDYVWDYNAVTDFYNVVLDLLTKYAIK